jgi:hypothetical protein
MLVILDEGLIKGPESRDGGGRHGGVPYRRGARQGLVGVKVTICDPLAFRALYEEIAIVSP